MPQAPDPAKALRNRREVFGVPLAPLLIKFFYVDLRYLQVLRKKFLVSILVIHLWLRAHRDGLLINPLEDHQILPEDTFVLVMLDLGPVEALPVHQGVLKVKFFVRYLYQMLVDRRFIHFQH